jgi:hypothetical protein
VQRVHGLEHLQVVVQPLLPPHGHVVLTAVQLGGQLHVVLLRYPIRRRAASALLANL